MGGRNAKQSQKTGLEPSYINPLGFPFGMMGPLDVVRSLAGIGGLGPFSPLLGGLPGCSPFGGLPFQGGLPWNNCSPFGLNPCGFGGLGGLGNIAPLAMPFTGLGCGPCGPFNGFGCSPFPSCAPFQSCAPFSNACAPLNACSPFNSLAPFGGLGCAPFAGCAPLSGCAPLTAGCNGIVPFRGSITPLAMPYGSNLMPFPGLLC